MKTLYSMIFISSMLTSVSLNIFSTTCAFWMIDTFDERFAYYETFIFGEVIKVEQGTNEDVVTLKVINSWKSVTPSIVDIHFDRSINSGFSYEIGVNLLIYTTTKSVTGNYYISPCNPSGSMDSNWVKEDLQRLQSLPEISLGDISQQITDDKVEESVSQTSDVDVPQQASSPTTLFLIIALFTILTISAFVLRQRRPS